MVQVLDPVPSFGQSLGRNLGAGLGAGLSQGMQQAMQHKLALQQIRAKEDAKLQGKRQLFEALMGGEQQNSTAQQLTPQDIGGKEDQVLQIAEELRSKGINLDNNQLQSLYQAVQQQPEMQMNQQQGTPQNSLQDTEMEELALSLIDPSLGRLKTEQRGIRNKETEAARKETLPVRKEFADKGRAARKSIKNKEAMLAILKTGKVDDPLVVEAAKYLPGAIGNKLLSSETQLYKAGLFEEFGVLKSMFPGQIRVKEIELLEDKLATLDKSHEAKAKIMQNGIKKLEADDIYSRAAVEVEKKFPNARALEFDELVNELARPKIDKLYKDIVKEYDKIYFEYAPKKSTYVDQNGVKYKDVKKEELKELFAEAEKAGLELKVAK